MDGRHSNSTYYVASTFATILSTRVLMKVAKVIMTKVKNEGLSPWLCHLHITAPLPYVVLRHI